MNFSWDTVAIDYQLSEDFIRKFSDKLNWNQISIYQSLSENFIREFKNKVNWASISQHQILSESFIREFKDRLFWIDVSAYQKLSEDFIKEFQDRVSLVYIFVHQNLSEDFIRKFQNVKHWCYISAYQKLSEDFIRESHWENVSKNQKLSENFIREFKDRVNWHNILYYQKLSDSFLKEFNWEYPEFNWLYTTNEEKRKKVKGKYEIDGDYVIAYKATRSNGYSVFNFQYQYEVGKTYESHCDYNLLNENSFGLSAWTRYDALKYHSKGKLFKVKIHLNDLGAMVCGNKLRAEKIEILEEIIYRRSCFLADGMFHI